MANTWSNENVFARALLLYLSCAILSIGKFLRKITSLIEANAMRWPVWDNMRKTEMNIEEPKPLVCWHEIEREAKVDE